MRHPDVIRDAPLGSQIPVVPADRCPRCHKTRPDNPGCPNAEFHATTDEAEAQRLANREAREGCDRCYCGCKYWEVDRCIDCDTSIHTLLRDPEWVAEQRPAE